MLPGWILAPSLHLLPLPIRSEIGRWLSSFTSCHSCLVWHHLSQTLPQLPLTVATVAWHWLHHTDWINNKRSRDVCVIHIRSCNSTLISVLYISLLTFQCVQLWESYLWGQSKIHWVFQGLTLLMTRRQSGKDKLYSSIHLVDLHLHKEKYDVIY